MYIAPRSFTRIALISAVTFTLYHEADFKHNLGSVQDVVELKQCNQKRSQKRMPKPNINENVV